MAVVQEVLVQMKDLKHQFALQQDAAAAARAEAAAAQLLLSSPQTA